MTQAAQQVVEDLPPFATMTQLVAYSHNTIDPGDPTAEVMLDAASNLIRQYCGWHIYPSVTFDLRMDGPGGVVLQLPSKHLTDVTSITESGTVTDAGAYRWSQLGEVERVVQFWPSDHWSTRWALGYGLLQVAFTSGYDTAPAELTAMVMSMVSRALASPAGVTREQAGAVSVQYSMSSQNAAGGLALMGNDLQQLDAYRIVGA